MNDKTLCEAIYASPEGAAVRRSKPITMPLLLAVCGAACLLPNLLFGETLSNDLRSATLLAGAVLLPTGLGLLVGRLRDREGRPCERATLRPLRRTERYYPAERRAEIARFIDEGDAERLLSLPDGGGAAVAVTVYRSRDGRFAAMQACEYVDFEYRPFTQVRIAAHTPPSAR